MCQDFGYGQFLIASGIFPCDISREDMAIALYVLVPLVPLVRGDSTFVQSCQYVVFYVANWCMLHVKAVIEVAGRQNLVELEAI